MSKKESTNLDNKKLNLKEALNQEHTGQPSNQLQRKTTFELDIVDEIPDKAWPEESEHNAFDDILETINSQGKYQKRFLYAFLCPLEILWALSQVGVFMFYIPNHWCHDPSWNESNYSTYAEWKDAFIPKEIRENGKEDYSRCKIYQDSNKSSTMNCPYEWNYDRSEINMTIPSEFNWVCERSYRTTIVFTSGGIAAVFAICFIGPVIDKFGRRKIFVLFTMVECVISLVTLFIPEYFEFFVGLNLLSAFFQANPHIILHEISDSEFRSWTSATVFTVYVLGFAAVPLVAYLIGNWFYMGLFAVVPRTLIFLLFILFFDIPESPRWLVSIGKPGQAKEILKRIANVNGTLDKVNDEELDVSLKRLSEAQKAGTKETVSPFMGFWTLLRQPRIAKNSLLLGLVVASNIFIYGGITLNTPYMPGNQFVTFFLLAIIEIPSSVLGGYLLQSVGRRWTPALFFTISGIACFIAAWNITNSIVVTVCIILSKFSVNLSLLVAVVQNVEIFPTNLRATGGSLTGVIGQIFSLTMPSIVNMGRSNSSIPYIAFGMCSIVGLICASLLPETLHQHLPETIEEANDFGKDHQFWSIYPHRVKSRRKRRSTFTKVSSIRRFHHDGSIRSRRESAVSYVKQVHPNVCTKRRASVMSYVGPHL